MLRTRELETHGISRVYLKRLVDSGQLARIGRGLYTLAEADLGEKGGLAQASKRVPHGVVCLLSALQLHGLTTQNPFEVWIAVDQKARRPAVSYPPLRIIHLSGKAFTSGIEDHGVEVEGINVRVYCPAKTVADCFKFRNKIGTDVALEALRGYRRKYRSGMDELWRYAKVVRVTSNATISGGPWMSPTKPRKVAASVRQKLTNLSKQRGEEFQFVLSEYAIERLLYRISRSQHSE